MMKLRRLVLLALMALLVVAILPAHAQDKKVLKVFAAYATPIEEPWDGVIHAALQKACDAHGSDYYSRFKKWADDYFYIPHRQCHRGVGGIFYDHVECADATTWEANFAFTQAVGEAFLSTFPMLVRRRMGMAFTPDEKLRQLEWRGRYAEFNLVYDRGTAFGLKTGGNIDAILMSLPPEAVWS